MVCFFNQFKSSSAINAHSKYFYFHFVRKKNFVDFVNVVKKKFLRKIKKVFF